MTLERVANVDELWDDEMRGLVVCGQRVLLIRLAGHVFAYEDRCAHLGVKLSDGRLEHGVLTCSAHHYQYDARTGCGINPRGICLKPYPLAIKHGALFVDVDRVSR